VLSWDLARDFVAYDAWRSGQLKAAPSAVSLTAPGTFRSVRRLVYLSLVGAGAGDFLVSLGLKLPASGDVPIPTSGQATALVAQIETPHERTRETSSTRVSYSIVIPKPFCATGPYDFVKLEGPVELSITVATHSSGRYDRTHTVGGTLQVTPMTPTSPTTFVAAGEPVEALVFEVHRAMLDDGRDQLTERGTQLLLGAPPQSLRWRFAAGAVDRFARQVLCGE
jgi:hypothetical protein